MGGVTAVGVEPVRAFTRLQVLNPGIDKAGDDCKVFGRKQCAGFRQLFSGFTLFHLAKKNHQAALPQQLLYFQCGCDGVEIFLSAFQVR